MLTQEQRQKLRNAGYDEAKINAFEAKKAIQESEPQQNTGNSYGQNLAETYTNAGERIRGAVTQAQQDFQAGQEMTNNGMITPAGVAKSAGAVVRGVGRTLGTVAGATFAPVLDIPAVKNTITSGIEGALENDAVAQVAGKAAELAQKYPDAAKDLEDIVNITTVGIGKIGEKPVQELVTKAGQKAVQIGKQAGANVGKAVTGVKKIAGEVIPSTERIVNSQVSKALDLTAGDVKNINLSTGNEVGQFLADKNLIRDNKDETIKALTDFYDESYKSVRSEIGKVTKTYSPSSVPRYTEALKAIKKQVDGVPGLQKVSVEVENLLNKGKKSITLNDAQRVKELMDEHFNLYKVTGDVKEGVAKEGLANMRTDLKEFIEKEVKNSTGADIKTLNNEVSTSRSTLNAIEERSTRGLTSSNLKIGDLGTFGVGSMFGGPLPGLAALVAKKIAESSAVRLKVARWLDGISDARKLKIKESLNKGEVPPDLLQVVETQSTVKPKASIKKTNIQNTSI